MTYTEFLSEFEQLIDAPTGSVAGQEDLADLEGWDSIATMMFIAMVDEKLGQTLMAQDVSGAVSVADLAVLAGVTANRGAA